LLAGPVFTREAVTAPRRPKMYLSRAVYVIGLWVLMLTLWMVFTGTQQVRNLGDLARFGHVLFLSLSALQMAVLLFFSALSTASAVALEKDRRTLELLLMTRLSNGELVLGKLLASMLSVLMLLAAALPFFMLTMLFGGVSPGQVLRVFAVTLLSALAAGSLGSLLAVWREKTFQTLALTVLCLLFWPGACEAVRWIYADGGWQAFAATAASPVHAIAGATQPLADGAGGWLGSAVNVYLLVAAAAAVLLNALAIFGVRRWNPTREAARGPEEEHPEAVLERAGLERADSEQAVGQAARLSHGQDAHATRPAGRQDAYPTRHPDRQDAYLAHRQDAHGTREVWNHPIIWREMRTWAYGRKVVFVRMIYLLLAAASIAALYLMARSDAGITRYGAALATLPLFVLSLMLINAQGVTSLTNERDAKALDLLLVTDVSAKEFVFGKLGGIFYNTKEMVVLPLVACLALWWLGGVSAENMLYLLAGLAVMMIFVAMLGVHTGMAYANSRTAIATSLGTVFFLVIGVATCMWMMVVFGGGSFQVQLAPFVVFILGGGLGLYVALGSRNPSPAIGLASLIAPFATFYAITSYVVFENTLGVLLVVSFTYGFTTAAMLVPAVYEFDVATGRTTGGED
jgi:ABC-type transport system involved in multi-copper enzyme maturation permease subunit